MATAMISINNVNIDQLVYREHRVVTFEQIATVHGIKVNMVRKAYQNHKQRFVEGKHYFRLDFAEASQLCPVGVANPNGMLVFTEAGYLLLVKPMRDDTSWRVQEEMVETYFRAKELIAQGQKQVTAWDVILQLAEAGRQLEERQHQLEVAVEAQKQQLIDQQAAVIASQQAIIEANTKAELALRQQQWITLRQYVAVNALERQVSPSMQKAYGQWLSGYCLEHNIPISREPVADRPYESENRYHVGTIEATLPGWLSRREGQPPLVLLSTPMATTP